MVGKGPGRYNLYLGAAFDGSRVAKLYAEDLEHDGIVAALDPLFAAYAKERHGGEHFGDLSFAPALWRRPEMAGISMRYGGAARRINMLVNARHNARLRNRSTTLT